MAASVRSATVSDESSLTTSHVVDLPPTVVAGDRLVIALSFDLNGVAMSVSNTAALLADGWLFDCAQTNGSIAYLLALSKTADGDEGGTTVTITTGGSYQSNHRSWSIQDWNAYAVGTPATGVSGTFDPPAVTFGWGAASDSYFLVIAGNERRFPGGSAPTDFGNYGENLTADTGLRWADRTAVLASPYDPGAFGPLDSGQADQWITQTYVFEAASADTFTGAGAPTEADDTAAGSGSFDAPTYAGTGAPVEADDVSSGAGAFTAPSYDGAGAPVEADDVSAGAGSFVAPVYTGTGAIVEADDTAVGVGLFAAAVYSGSGSPVESDDQATGSGTFVPAPNTFTGSGAPVEEDDTSTGVGTFSGGPVPNRPGSGTSRLAGPTGVTILDGPFVVSRLAGPVGATTAR